MHGILKKKIGYGALVALACTALLSARNVAATTAVPLPQPKPQSLAQQITEISLAEAAPDTGAIPMPAVKPELPTDAEDADPGTPSIAALLGYGMAPLPGRKPAQHSKGILKEDDAALYSKIFLHQSSADWQNADKLIAQLGDFRLRGHVLFQRYMHPTAYKTSFDELAGWMESYADHPGAHKIYNLAMKRIPKDYKGSVRQPVKSEGINGYLDILSDHNRAYHAPQKRSTADTAVIRQLTKAIMADIAKDAPSKALHKLKHDKAARLLDEGEQDELQAQIANGFMIAGKYEKAYALALESSKRSGGKVPLAGWVGGLTAWQLGKYKQAASLFEQTARSSYASDWTAAAGSYWASRAHMRTGNVKDVSVWLRSAASYPRTFYGLIATRALGWDFDFNWNMPAYTEAHKKLLMKYPGAQRAMLLVRAGQYHLAEKELRQIDPKQAKGLTEALLAYANEAGLPSYAMRLASSVKTPEGGLYDAALYPLSPWTPQSGYKIDRALIHALIRQESKFNPAAQSRSGATGLMQLMPATAAFVSGRRDYRSREGQYTLKEPQLNLDIGQRYVESLLTQDHVSTELFSLVIAYNAGPGNLRKWKTAFHTIQNDPLLFVEMIPMRETRAFVERVMANYWIYRLRMNQPTPSLDAVAEGNWARYVQLDAPRKAAASLTEPYQMAAR